jgi:hypothetical protein
MPDKVHYLAWGDSTLEYTLRIVVLLVAIGQLTALQAAYNPKIYFLNFPAHWPVLVTHRQGQRRYHLNY